MTEDTPYFHTAKFGPISIGLPDGDKYKYGYGRTISVVYSCDWLENEGVLSQVVLDIAENWIKEKWENKVLLDKQTPNLHMFETLNDLRAIDVAIMPDQYDSSLKSACQFIYDYLDAFHRTLSQDRVHVVEVEIVEQRDNYEFKTERYFGGHKYQHGIN